MKNYKKLLLFLFIGMLIFSPFYPLKQVLALDFNPNEIISNYEMQDYLSMDLHDIQRFLDNQNGVLKNYITENHLGKKKSAAEIIYQASQDHKMSPKWILATLQKEQSLITNPSPSQYNIDWAMGYAVCDSCSVEDPKVQLFKGFGMQVDRAAKRVRYYFDHPWEFNFRVGQMYQIDGRDVLVYNQATANLYIYTPHIHGNYNFWNIWNRWFSKLYPDGAIVRQEGTDKVYLIENGKRRLFWSKSALISRYDESNVIDITRTDLNKYEEGNPIKYPNYSLLQTPQGDIYLIVNNEKKHITSMEVFRTIGFNLQEVIEVGEEELDYYDNGSEITLTSAHPQGALLQNNQTGGVYYVEDGIKYPVWSREIMETNYKNYQLTSVSPEELAKYKDGNNATKFKDGALVKLSYQPEVYVISNGKRRWIKNEYTFNQMGYDWNEIKTINDQVASLHPVGEELDLLIPGDTGIAIY